MGTSAQKRLTDLLKGLALVPAGLDCWVGDIQQDSRKITQGALFIAAEGIRSDGAAYVQDAVHRGAVAVIQPGLKNQVYEDNNVVFIELEQVKPLVGEIAHRFFGQVTQGMQVVGVTGTNGKSSVTHYIAQLARLVGVKAAVIGTLGYGDPTALKVTSHTTPDAVSVHRHLFELYEQGYELVAMEVSSHALDQYRVAGVEFVAGTFTNLSRDHLDYHGTMDNYGEAKRKLFASGAVRPVLNLNDTVGQRWAEELKERQYIGYASSKHSDATIWAENVKYHAAGINFQLCSDAFCFEVRTSLLGSFNLENVLASVASLLGLGYDFAQLAEHIGQVEPVSGRMESLASSTTAPTVVVDYAHTPDALETVLKALRCVCKEQLWCVFGCGGDRDPGKRPLMGQAAESWADHIVLTDDNPRTEEPGIILRDILQGINEKDKVQVVQPRDQAIEMVLRKAGDNDVVLIAGKGHEDYQEIRGKRHYFSDREIATEILLRHARENDSKMGFAEGWS